VQLQYVNFLSQNPFVVTGDQLGLNLLPSGKKTFEKRGPKQVPTWMTRGLSLSSLPVQLLAHYYHTLLPLDGPLPTKNHWANKTTLVQIANEILAPYRKKIIEELGLPPNQ